MRRSLLNYSCPFCLTAAGIQKEPEESDKDTLDYTGSRTSLWNSTEASLNAPLTADSTWRCVGEACCFASEHDGDAASRTENKYTTILYRFVPFLHKSFAETFPGTVWTNPTPRTCHGSLECRDVLSFQKLCQTQRHAALKGDGVVTVLSRVLCRPAV